MLLFSRQSHFYRLWGLGRRLKQWNIYSSLIILPNSPPCLLRSFPYHVVQLEPGAFQFCCSFICSSILHWLYAIYKYVTSMCSYSCLRKVFFSDWSFVLCSHISHYYMLLIRECNPSTAMPLPAGSATQGPCWCSCPWHLLSSFHRFQGPPSLTGHCEEQPRASSIMKTSACYSDLNKVNPNLKVIRFNCSL